MPAKGCAFIGRVVGDFTLFYLANRFLATPGGRSLLGVRLFVLVKKLLRITLKGNLRAATRAEISETAAFLFLSL